MELLLIKLPTLRDVIEINHAKVTIKMPIGYNRFYRSEVLLALLLSFGAWYLLCWSPITWKFTELLQDYNRLELVRTLHCRGRARTLFIGLPHCDVFLLLWVVNPWNKITKELFNLMKWAKENPPLVKSAEFY